MRLSLSPTILPDKNTLLSSPDQVLKTLVYTWFVIAFIGQYYFAIYVSVRYGIPISTGDYAQINLSHHVTGYVSGDKSGNIMLFGHVIAAALLGFGGLLQLLPVIRHKFPWLHRWNGRMFLTLGFLGALTGLYLTWLRDSRLSDIGSLGVTVNGLLIPVAVYLAWRYAIAKQFKQHQRWAIHAFFLINGVWTFRIYMMAWYTLTGGGWGNSSKLDGPADMLLSFACYLLPMAIAELVFRAQKSRQNGWKWFTNGLLAMAILVTLLGLCIAIIFSWNPAITTAIDAGL